MIFSVVYLLMRCLMVLRTPVPASQLDAPGVVSAYKNLKYVERDFRHLKADDLDLRPVYHHLKNASGPTC